MLPGNQYKVMLKKIFTISCFSLIIFSCTKAPVGIKEKKLAPEDYIFKFPSGELKAGVGSVEITPSRPQYLAGFGFGRKSTGIHDPIYARAVVLEKGGERLALVSLDVLGIQRHHLLEDYFPKIQGIDSRRIIITCTHNHSAPDTMGFWGRIPGMDGRDPEWIEELTQKVAEAVKGALSDLEPVELVLGKGEVAERGVVRNIREPKLVDRELGVVGIYPLGSEEPKAILVNFAMHAETLWEDNKEITADWPGYMRRYLEKWSGAKLAIFFNGALGAMVTVDNQLDEQGREVHDFKEAERVGRAVAETALKALYSGARLSSPEMIFAKRIFYLPVENPLYNLFAHTPKITRKFYWGNFQTELNYLRLGDWELLTVPGEAYPKLGFSLKDKLSARYKWIVGLANDELGYLLYPGDYYNPLYSYEVSVSFSPHYGGALLDLNAGNLLLAVKKASLSKSSK